MSWRSEKSADRSWNPLHRRLSPVKGSRRREVSRSTLASILTPFSPAGSRLTVADHRTAAAHAPGILPTDSPPSTGRSEEHTSELQSLMRISYAVFCLKQQTKT